MQNKPLMPEFSVVIPIFNEEENIPELYGRLTAVMEKLGSYEIIMVDDGSKDKSWELIKELHNKDKRVKGISFSRNFGHHIAITTGLDHARGEAVILMDGDLQDPPEEISRLYQKFKEGYDIVYGIRKVRHDLFLKRLTSSIFWWILRKFSGVNMPAGQTMLRILSKRVVDVLREMREYARFVHGMMAWTGFNVTTVYVQHNPRYRGRSKYNIPRLFKLAFHAVTSFSTVPLRLATYTGLASSFVSFLTGLYFIYRKIFFSIPILGYASIIVSIFFVGGIQLLVLGILGEYLGRTYQEVQRRPLYIVKEFLLE
ncbi:MAG: glycosyltransferase family 2 protein [Thermodesulfovibrionales bacterium]